MDYPETPTKIPSQVESNHFVWLMNDNWTFVEKAFCMSSVEMVVIWILFSIEFLVICLALFGLCCLFRSDQTVPLFVINLFISDIIQICLKPILNLCSFNIVMLFLFHIYVISLIANIGFMVCISIERYIMIKYPVWYRFHRTLKHYALICLIVWTLPCGLIGIDVIIVLNGQMQFAFLLSVFIFVIPYPLVVFTFVGSWRALSHSVSVTPDEQKRILWILVLVLFNYTVLFLPNTIQSTMLSISFEYGHKHDFNHLNAVSGILLYLNPLADSLLYVFIRKDANNMLGYLCCKKPNENQEQTVEFSNSLSQGNEIEISVQT